MSLHGRQHDETLQTETVRELCVVILYLTGVQYFCW